MKSAVVVFLSLAMLSAPAAWAAEQSDPSRGSSDASALMADGSAAVVAGGLSVLAGASKVVVRSVEASGDVVLVVLAGASEAGEASLRFTGKAAKKMSVAAGTVVAVSVVSTGYLLMISGEVVAFVPNELGKALLHHAPVTL